MQDVVITHVLFKGYIVKVPSMYQVETQHIVLNGTSKIGLILQRFPWTPQDYIVETYIEITVLMSLHITIVFICGLEPHNNTK